MFPYVSREKSSQQLLSRPSTKGNTRHEKIQSIRRSIHSHLIATEKDINKDSMSEKSEFSAPKLNPQPSTNLIRKRSQSCILPSPKALKLSSLNQTKLPTVAKNEDETRKCASDLGRPNNIQTNKVCDLNHERSSLVKNPRFPRPKTPPHRETRSKSPNQTEPNSKINLVQTCEQNRIPNFCNSGQKSIGPSLKTPVSSLPISLQISHPVTSKSKENTISTKKGISRYLIHGQKRDITENASDSEDPLTSIIPVSHLRPTTPIRSRSAKKKTPSTQTSPPLCRPVRTTASSNNNNEYNDKSSVLSLYQESDEKHSTTVVDLSSPVKKHQSPENDEPAATVQLRPRKNRPKDPVVKRVKRQKEKTHLEVPVPDPVYYSFKCEWKQCRAELMNMEILRKHMYAAHSKKLEGGGRRCLWGKCGRAWEEFDQGSGTTDSEDKNAISEFRVIYHTRKEWKEHIEECHMIPFSWHMGDGPCGSRLAKPSTVWQQPYLFLANGQQATPSVASQPIEEGKVCKLNARRFHWVRGAGPFGGDILVPISQIKGSKCLKSVSKSSGNQYVEHEVAGCDDDNEIFQDNLNLEVYGNEDDEKLIPLNSNALR